MAAVGAPSSRSANSPGTTWPSVVMPRKGAACSESSRVFHNSRRCGGSVSMTWLCVFPK
jgi:hypothetical protein